MGEILIVVMANDLPPAVRGRMKLWFIEPKPNVFISGIKDSVADKVVEYLFKHCSIRSGLLIFQKTNYAPGYSIRSIGGAIREITEISGLQLIIEKNLS